MTKKKSKISFIVVLYKTPKKEVIRLKKEIINLGIDKNNIYFIDNTNTNCGYGQGINLGVKKTIGKEYKIFIIVNPDISINNVKFNDILGGLKKFDILGFAMKQDERIYYGGEIDKWRMSGGLISKKPSIRYVETDFISGSLMIIKRKAFDKIGLFDEGYFMYYEDVDFCYRAKKAGFKVGIDSKIHYDHYEVSKNWKEKESWLNKSRLKFFNKYSSWPQRIYENIYRWWSFVRK